MILRFLVDESTGYLVTNYLLDAGYDAISVVDLFPRVSDKDILAYAVQEDRIVITNDKDFGDLIFFAHLAHRGVILLRTEEHRPFARWRLLEPAIQRYALRLQGAFTVITNEGIRIRY
jgi:predicted nuclease of predicted toxin-antitoxin system